jgi:uncharacterized protein DUF624
MSGQASGQAVVRRGWRRTVTEATDLALLGMVVTIAALPVVTAGAAVAAGSVAARRWCADRDLPPWRELAGAYRRALVPGAAATAVVAVAALLLGADLRALSGGRVPGGRPAALLTVAAALLAAGWAAATVVRRGERDGTGWRPAARAAAADTLAVPWLAPALGGVLAVAGALAWLVPACLPVLVGFTLLGLHVTSGLLRGGRP